MVYRVELKNTEKELRKGILQSLLPVCIISAVMSVAAVWGVFSIIGFEVDWEVYAGAALPAPLLIMLSALCIRTDNGKDGTTFYTATDAGLMTESEDSMSFIPWKRVKALRLLPVGLMITNVDGFSSIHALGDMTQEKRQELLEYARQQVAVRADAAPIPPPAWAMTDKPLLFSPTKEKAQQVADVMSRIMAPALGLVLLIILGIFVICLGTMGLVAASDMPYGLLTALLVWCMISQIRHIFHPGNKLILKALSKCKTENHVRQGSWLVHNADGSGAWGISRFEPEEVVVRRGKGQMFCILNNKSALPVDDNQELPDWLPAPTGKVATPTHHKVAALLAPVMAALLFWGTYQGMKIWIDSIECSADDCPCMECSNDLSPQYGDKHILEALKNPTPEAARKLAATLVEDESKLSECSLTRRDDGTWLLRYVYGSNFENKKEGARNFILHENGYILDYLQE